MTDIAVSCLDLGKNFGQLRAVSELQLEIPRASIYGFLGPNGSGKTTAIRMLCGLIAPSAGRADVLGYRMPRDAEKLRQHIGYMPQKNALYTDLTVLENLHFMARIQGVARRDAQQRSNELLQRYQLDRFRDSLVAGLSGGERQKAALAVAILHRPALLFLDEPTSEVDPQSRRDFWDSLFELVDGGTTILLTSHFMDEAERCHRLAVLHRGRKMVDGAPAQLMSQIDASVVLVDPVDARAARQCLLAASFVLSVAQIGSTLRVLVDKAERQPHQVVRSWLRQQGIVAECTAIRANLEDVFVVATQLARQA